MHSKTFRTCTLCASGWAFVTVCMLIYSVNCMNLQPAVRRVGDALRHADLASQDVPVLMLARSQSHARQLIYLYRDRRASSPDWSVPHQWLHRLEGDTLLFIKPRGCAFKCATLRQWLQLSLPMLRAAVCAFLQGAFRSTCRLEATVCPMTRWMEADKANKPSNSILCVA